MLVNMLVNFCYSNFVCHLSVNFFAIRVHIFMSKVIISPALNFYSVDFPEPEDVQTKVIKQY